LLTKEPTRPLRSAESVIRLSDCVDLGTIGVDVRLGGVPKYFFHLISDVPAHDLIGHECENDEEARENGSFIAHRIGTEKPEMVREGNFISVSNGEGAEILRAPLASTTR
jgi:hypothetical protein